MPSPFRGIQESLRDATPGRTSLPTCLERGEDLREPTNPGPGSGAGSEISPEPEK